MDMTFLYGLFFSLIGFLLCKGKGRILVDLSTHTHDADDTDALNNQMERTDPEQFPRASYASSQRRHW